MHVAIILRAAHAAHNSRTHRLWRNRVGVDIAAVKQQAYAHIKKAHPCSEKAGVGFRFHSDMLVDFALNIYQRQLHQIILRQAAHMVNNQ